MLSVPPEVMKPDASPPPWSRSAVMPTTSDWILARLGKAIVLRALSCRNIWATVSTTSWASGPAS